MATSQTTPGTARGRTAEMPPPSYAPFADVALPVPLPDPLVYEIPAPLKGAVAVGSRVRVGVGARRLVGVVVELHARRPEGVNLRPVEEVLDREPAVPPSLLELARFVSSYYMAPLGEVLRTMLPADLPPWGGRKV